MLGCFLIGFAKFILDIIVDLQTKQAVFETLSVLQMTFSDSIWL